MTDWSAGYVTDIGYNLGYYTELNPLRLPLAFLQAGIAFPAIATACELGFGQGVSINMHAAATATSWYGTDFNASQVVHARTLAANEALSCQLYDQPFAQFCQRTDLPEFDFIALHGVWTWISDENRQVIVDFLQRKLRVGGVLYISYYTLPAWVTMLPMRDLLYLYEQRMTAPGLERSERIEQALAFTDRLLACHPAYSEFHPQVMSKWQSIRQNKNIHYLSHEYFNREWQPMPFSRLAEWLSASRLHYVCSAHGPDNRQQDHLTAEQLTFVNGIADLPLRETTLDLMVNRQFRRDYWVKGSRTLPQAEKNALLHRQRVVLTVVHAQALAMAAQSAGRPLPAMQPVLQLLSDHQSRSLAELSERLREQGFSFEQVWEAVAKLLAMNTLQPAQGEAESKAARLATDRLNGRLLDWVLVSDTFGFMASPVTGGGVAISKIERLFLAAYRLGQHTPEGWAGFADQSLSQQGQRLAGDHGEMLTSRAQHVQKLTAMAESFMEQKFPLFRALQVV
ncbi:MAG: class I SAM-dependent methyltransferase [Magnetococcales bacterium]|nr:class I SAM-dependent methyltransferase [Magnetococcales bacterium]